MACLYRFLIDISRRSETKTRNFPKEGSIYGNISRRHAIFGTIIQEGCDVVYRSSFSVECSLDLTYLTIQVTDLVTFRGLYLSPLLSPLLSPFFLLFTVDSDERLKRHAAHKRDVIVYNEELDSKFCIYFPGDYREEYRILTHFYAYLYWANPHEERIYKR